MHRDWTYWTGDDDFAPSLSRVRFHVGPRRMTWRHWPIWGVALGDTQHYLSLN